MRPHGENNLMQAEHTLPYLWYGESFADCRQLLLRPLSVGIVKETLQAHTHIVVGMDTGYTTQNIYDRSVQIWDHPQEYGRISILQNWTKDSFEHSFMIAIFNYMIL